MKLLYLLRCSLVQFFFLLPRLPFCRSDLPIHALTSEVTNGDGSKEFWQFSLTDFHENPRFCGGGPSTLNTILQQPDIQNYTDWLKNNMGGAPNKINLILTDVRSKPITTSTNQLQNQLLATNASTSFLESSHLMHRNNWLALGVLDHKSRSLIGGWTMVYDEGFYVSANIDRTKLPPELLIPTIELKKLKQSNRSINKHDFLNTKYSSTKPLNDQNAKPQSFFFHGVLKYTQTDNDTNVDEARVCHLHVLADSDTEDVNGHTECYVTDPSQTSIGWYSTSEITENSSPNIRYGCFEAKKIKTANKSASLQSSKKLESYIKLFSMSEKAKQRTQFYIKNRKNSGALQSFVHPSLIKQIASISLLNPNSPLSQFNSTSYACELSNKMTDPQKKDSQITLPTNYSAMLNPFSTEQDRDRLNGVTNEDIIAQGECGSCYAVSSMYVLQSRANLYLHKKRKNGSSRQNTGLRTFSSQPYVPKLSIQDALWCSIYNQGCFGGYPFLIGKYTHEYGVPLHSCFNEDNSAQSSCFKLHDSVKSLFTSACNPDNFVYTSSYGYVGGCYECCSEKAMQHELFYNGPIVVAFHAPREIQDFQGNIYNTTNQKHSRVCDLPGHQMNGWEYTNHAAVVVGWGEEMDPIEKDIMKYWIVRNSWGKNWGTDGYFKILRGKNFLGIENQAVYMDPDFQRGYLKKILT